MPVRDEIRDRIQEIARERELAEDKAFGYWFLEEIENLSQEESELMVVDGPWDGGRDAVYLDEENGVLTIYQFKYSEEIAYVFSDPSELQRAIIAEREHLSEVREVKLYLVTLAKSNNEISESYKKIRTRIRGWLTRQGFNLLSKNTDLEIFDLIKFTQVFEKIYGVDIELRFNSLPIIMDDSILGLIDGSDFKENINREELLAFNIRKFLTRRKGSVNYQIKESLENEDSRNNFWKLNNGIVCLCTDYNQIDALNYGFANFTIVNGAQTINSISKFLLENPTIDDSIWILAKIMKVNEDDLETGIKLTKTSNTQNPTSNRDLRSVDISHSRLKTWFDEHFNIHYLYKRGDRARSGAERISMKDIAQSYIAYWKKEPFISFSRPGKIFSDSDYYFEVFPGDEIEILRSSGEILQIKEFLLNRIIPSKILFKIRQEIKRIIKIRILDKSWKSLTYHILWLYKRIFDLKSIIENEELLRNIDSIITSSFEEIFLGLYDFCLTKKIDMPRDLKSTKLKDEIMEGQFMENSRMQTAISIIKDLLDNN